MNINKISSYNKNLNINKLYQGKFSNTALAWVRNESKCCVFLMLIQGWNLVDF